MKRPGNADLEEEKRVELQLLLQMRVVVAEGALGDQRRVADAHVQSHRSRRQSRGEPRLPLEGLATLGGGRRSGGVGGGGVGEADEMHRGIPVLFDEPIGTFLGQSAKQKRSQGPDLPVQVLRVQRRFRRFRRFRRLRRLRRLRRGVGWVGGNGDLD